MNYHVGRIVIPPWLPMPGMQIDREDGQTPETYAFPTYMGSTFTELCKLMPIVHEMLHVYYDGGDRVAPSLRAPFDFAEKTYDTLLQWSAALPLDMARGDQMPHHAAVAQYVQSSPVRTLTLRPKGKPCSFTDGSAPLFTFAASNTTPQSSICSAPSCTRTQPSHRTSSSTSPPSTARRKPSTPRP